MLWLKVIHISKRGPWYESTSYSLIWMYSVLQELHDTFPRQVYRIPYCFEVKETLRRQALHCILFNQEHGRHSYEETTQFRNHNNILFKVHWMTRLTSICVNFHHAIASHYIRSFISYLGMKSWDLHVCDRASTITHVDRVKKVIFDTTRYDFA